MTYEEENGLDEYSEDNFIIDLNLTLDKSDFRKLIDRTQNEVFKGYGFMHNFALRTLIFFKILKKQEIGGIVYLRRNDKIVYTRYNDGSLTREVILKNLK